MAPDIDTVKNILENLKEDPMRVIYTEHYLMQIERRKIPDICVEELVENGNLLNITHITKLEYGLLFRLEDSRMLYVTVRIFNLEAIILISSSYENRGASPPPEYRVELEEIYDLAFDLMDITSKHGFRFNQSVEMESGFYIDFDICGHPAAIELIHASKKFKLQQKQMASAQLSGQIEITQDLITIRLKATFANSETKTRVIEKEIANDYGIPENIFELVIEDIS